MKKLILLACLCLICIIAHSQNVNIEKDGFKWIPYMEYGRMGAKSAEGKIIVPAKYETCYYERGHFFVRNFTKNPGIFSIDGKVLVPTKNIFQINEIAGIKNSPFIIVGEGGYGVYSSNGEELIPRKYFHITPYQTSKGIYYVVIAYNGFSGLIDARGKIIIHPNKYKALIISTLNNKDYITFLKYGKNRGSGICDLSGNVIFDTKYSYVIPELDSYNKLFYKIAIGNSVGKMAQDGTIIKAPIAKKSYNLNKFGDESLYVVIDENSRFGVANNKRQLIIPCEYDFIKIEYPYIYVTKDRFMGMFDRKFKPIISTDKKYVATTYVDDINEPFINAITENYKQALYDLQGNQLSEPLYSKVYYHVFSNTKDTVLCYRNDMLYGVAALNGKSIIQPRYDVISFMDTPIGNFYCVWKDNLMGLCNSDGIEIIEPQFTEIEFRRQRGKDYFYAVSDDYASVFNTDGTRLINGETFSTIIYDEEDSQFVATQGSRICYFTKDGILLRDNYLDIERDKYISIADSYFEEGKYRRAAKNYGLALNIAPTPSLYFNRGVSYYNMGKYNDAISDFRLCLENNPSKNLHVRSLELIDKAEEYQLQKEQRNANIASAIFGLVLTGANMYFQSQIQNKYNRSNTSYNSKTYSPSDTDADYDDDNDIKLSNSASKDCPSLKVNHGKWFCANTGECGMCGGDGLMDNPFGLPDDKCTLCGGTGKCKYCQ